jgi:prevent-host-death family protein
MKRIGSRELKNRLGRYLTAVRRGESLLVTDRGRTVAKLSPAIDPASEEKSIGEILKEMEAAGLVRLPRRPLKKIRPARIKGASAAQAVIEDRQ